MRHAIDQLGLKGSVLVVKNSRPWLKYATANKPDTSYLINSVQKSMTATMVMRAVQNHKLKLSTKLSEFYPEVAGADQVTVANLLNMTSGLDLRKGEKLGTDVYISDEDNFKSDVEKTVFNPKMLGKWHYTSVNYVYLCGILSKIENKSYEEMFRATYIKPLKLKHTEFLWANIPQLKASGWVPSYRYRDGRYKRVKHERAVKDARDELGAGSIVMSDGDLAKTLHAILAGNLLTQKSRSILFTGKAPSYYNGGLYNTHQFKKANGAGEGYFTFLRTTNDAKYMIIIQSNRTNHDRFNSLKSQISGIMSLLLTLE
ncbi:MAG: beta-lactamase family protein [Candidatus Lactobacillus pullistercoris]|uniref:Beta-lactamase family protein n=1 Tax=Candidatus Lactobacillus pullistercoris TaxID=2838636 RepID=A0A9E2NUE6_9LACO|nr:beta-lactamase family protein [Candidatus Lactobacillus pullistercoris]